MRQSCSAIALSLGILLGIFSAPSQAADAPPSVAAVKVELIQKLESDGYLSRKLAQESREKYITAEDVRTLTTGSALTAPSKSEPTLWERYLSWTNFFKVAGVILLLVAFGGGIARMAKGLMWLIVQVPQELYQACFLSATLVLTLRPSLIWPSQGLYLALFGAFANLILLAWIVGTHKKLELFLEKLFNLGLPLASVLSFWGVLYFGALALAYESAVFGFFAAVCLSGVFTFGIYYRPGVLTLHFEEKGLGAVIFGHLLVLGAYATLKATGHLPSESEFFVAGLEYYCTIAMGVGFLVGASPWGSGRQRNQSRAGYSLLFVIVLLVAIAGYFFFGLQVIGSILCCIAVLLALEWIGYFGYSAGFLIGTFLMGIVLYGSSLLLENYGHLIVLRMI